MFLRVHGVNNNNYYFKITTLFQDTHTQSYKWKSRDTHIHTNVHILKWYIALYIFIWECIIIFLKSFYAHTHILISPSFVWEQKRFFSSKDEEEEKKKVWDDKEFFLCAHNVWNFATMRKFHVFTLLKLFFYVKNVKMHFLEWTRLIKNIWRLLLYIYIPINYEKHL